MHEETLHPWLSKSVPVEDSYHCANAQVDLNLRWAHLLTLWLIVVSEERIHLQEK